MSELLGKCITVIELGEKLPISLAVQIETEMPNEWHRSVNNKQVVVLLFLVDPEKCFAVMDAARIHMGSYYGEAAVFQSMDSARDNLRRMRKDRFRLIALNFAENDILQAASWLSKNESYREYFARLLREVDPPTAKDIVAASKRMADLDG